MRVDDRLLRFGRVTVRRFSVFALFFVSSMSHAAPSMIAQSLDRTPVVDGNVLDDGAWTAVAAASGFWQVKPNDGEPSTQRTEVRIGYTDNALYIAVVAYDDNPDGIIVTDSRRDSSLDDTDAFLVIIDGMRDRRNGYVFGTNAAGVEYDGQVTREGADLFGAGGRGFDLNWDGSWQVKSIISDFGWSAEFEIPFQTLRYGSDLDRPWGINFQRNIRRNNEIAYWSPLDRNHNLYRVSEAGTISGIVPPPNRNLKLTPYVLGTRRSGGELPDTENDSEFGFDIKYSITPSLTLDVTYNTDFAQVEADEQQINLDRFNLFFPEKRPFFLENLEQFAVGTPQETELFFSRRIGISEDGTQIPVDGGVRMSGKVGSSTNVGLLYMSTESVEGIAPGNQYTVARINQDLGNRSSIGAIYVGRDGDGSYLSPAGDDNNRTFGLDGRLGIGDHLIVQSWIAKTETPGLNGRDDAFEVKADYSSPKWTSRFLYSEVGVDFNPEVGFLSRKDFRSVSTTLLRRIRPSGGGRLLEMRPHVSYNGYWNFDGFQETGFLHMDSHFEYRSGTELHTAVNLTRAGILDPFEIIDGVVIQPGTYDHTEIQIIYFTNQSRPLSFRLDATVGGRFGGDRASIAPQIKFRIGESFSSELSINYNDFDLPVPDGQFTANLAKLRLSYSFTPKILMQALVQYNDLEERLGTNLRFSWLQSANSGLYLVYNEVDEQGIGALPTGREFILKYSRIFDVLN